MKFLLILLLLFQLVCFGCSSSQVKLGPEHERLDWFVDHYVRYYSIRDEAFNSKNNYLVISISDDEVKNKTHVYISDYCYECNGPNNSLYSVFSCKGYKLVLATDGEKNKTFF